MNDTVYTVTKSPHCYHQWNPGDKVTTLVNTSSPRTAIAYLRTQGIDSSMLEANYDDHLWWLEAKLPNGEFVTLSLDEVEDDGETYMIPDSEYPYRRSRYDDDWNHGRLGACDC